jgi:hypothetical protein
MKMSRGDNCYSYGSINVNFEEFAFYYNFTLSLHQIEAIKNKNSCRIQSTKNKPQKTTTRLYIKLELHDVIVLGVVVSLWLNLHFCAFKLKHFNTWHSDLLHIHSFAGIYLLHLLLNFIKMVKEYNYDWNKFSYEIEHVKILNSHVYSDLRWTPHS